MKCLKLSLILIAIPLLTSCGFEQVDEGYRGIYTKWGKVEGEPLTPGLHFYNPVSANIFELPVMEKKFEEATDCFTKDTQTAKVTYAITYYPDPKYIGQIYSQFGKHWEEAIIKPAIQGSLKDAIGQYIADDLVSKREAVKKAAEQEVKEALNSRHVTVTRLDLVNLDFDDAYERAVEEKVVAVQKAAKAKNMTVEVEEKAKQTVASAKADAEAMRIKSIALSQNKGLVQYEAIQKWDGKLPQYMFGGNSIPMINLEKIKSE